MRKQNYVCPKSGGAERGAARVLAAPPGPSSRKRHVECDTPLHPPPQTGLDEPPPALPAPSPPPRSDSLSLSPPFPEEAMEARPGEDHHDFSLEPLDREGVARQRAAFLGLLEQICGKRASVTLRFHGPGGEHANRIGEKRWIRTLLSPPPPHTARLTPPSTLLSVCPLAVEGVSASGRLVAVESSLDEILVEDLRTPTGVLPGARVNMDDVLYVKLPDP